jgi:phenylalanyl-tRNA synthetase beta chain
LKRAALLIQEEVAGGEITSEIVDIYNKNWRLWCFLNFVMLQKLLVKKYLKDTIKQILTDIKLIAYEEKLVLG